VLLELLDIAEATKGVSAKINVVSSELRTKRLACSGESNADIIYHLA